MSAPNTPSGPNSTTPNTGPAPIIRRPKASAFMQRKKPVKKRVEQPHQKPNAATQQNGAPNSKPTPLTATAQAEEDPNFSEYPIFVTKGDLMRGLRHHVIKFLPKQDNHTMTNVEINPFDENQFTRPVHLHRRLARDKAIQQQLQQQEEENPGADDKEREMMLAKKAEREAQREADKAQIAPGGNEPKPTKRKNEKKFQYSQYIDEENDPVRAKRAKLRHEEARQWHLEDFDRKNTWVGSYEEPLSEQSAMFVVEKDGFRMVPLERWYKFIPTNKVQAMPIEHAEKYYKDKFKPDRWFMNTQKANEEAIKKAYQAHNAQGSQPRQKKQGEDEEDRKAFSTGDNSKYRGDVDEIDFEFDGEFQDDDEGMIFGDTAEEAKETYDKIRQEQREANLPSTGVKEEDRDWDLEEEMEKEQEKEERRRARKMRKALKKKEHKFEYDSDSERSYFSMTESEDSEEEREREAKEKEEEAKKQANGDKSGASTKGTNTPTGRAEKRSGAAGLGASLKRPGSPTLSDASGNESSRKKAKLANGSFKAADSRSLSPEGATRSGAGSGSDTESGSRPPKIRLKNSPPGSRANSPPPATTTASGASSPRRPLLTVEDIRNGIPEGGLTTAELIAKFKNRMPPKDEFTALVKKATNWNKETKRLTPKPEGQA